MRIGVISDTHGRLPEEALALLQGVQEIIHAAISAGKKSLSVWRQ